MNTETQPAVDGRVERNVRQHFAPTPGPWKAMGSKLGNDFGILDASGMNVIGECFADIRRQGEHALHEAAANARLMAAAPDLLAALNALLTHMGMDEDEWNKATFDQARRAVERAALVLPNVE